MMLKPKNIKKQQLACILERTVWDIRTLPAKSIATKTTLNSEGIYGEEKLIKPRL